MVRPKSFHRVSRAPLYTALALIAWSLGALGGDQALAKTPANCRILTFDGAAGAASFDKVTFRAVDAWAWSSIARA